MQSYEKGNSYNKARDVNHWLRRFFRCWLDGSYNGYEQYKLTLEYLNQHKNEYKKLRGFVISEFCKFIALEFDCNYTTTQKAIVKSGIDLEELNKQLIDDALDLIN